MVASTKKLFSALTRRGPHRVLRGDLAFAGLPGVVYTPESGMNLAGVALGHDWLAGGHRYEGTLEHLASWGMVSARRRRYSRLLGCLPRRTARKRWSRCFRR